MLSKWLEELELGSGSDFRKSNTELVHVGNGSVMLRKWRIEELLCHAAFWSCHLPAIGGSGRLPSEPLAPELCHSWIQTKKMMPCILPLDTYKVGDFVPGLLLTLLNKNQTLLGQLWLEEGREAWSLHHCCPPSLVHWRGQTQTTY